MKKLRLTVPRDVGARTVWLQVVSAWQTDTPGLAAWNHPGKLVDRVIKRCWSLVHVRSGYIIANTTSRADVLQLANLLDGLTDWDVHHNEIPQSALVTAGYRIGTFETERALAALEAA